MIPTLPRAYTHTVYKQAMIDIGKLYCHWSPYVNPEMYIAPLHAVLNSLHLYTYVYILYQTKSPCVPWIPLIQANLTQESLNYSLFAYTAHWLTPSQYPSTPYDIDS